MNDTKLLAIRLKKTMFSALLLENSTNPNPDTKAKILQFLPSSNRFQSWERSVSNTIPYLKDLNGKLKNSHADMCSIAASHLGSLFENKDTCSESEISVFLASLNLPKFSSDEKDILMAPFTLNEFNLIIKNMSVGKSSGKDCIPIDIFKNSTELCSILVSCANNTFLKRQPLPASLCSVLFRLIPKDSEKDSTDQLIIIDQ